jgi:hypothetical protein
MTRKYLALLLSASLLILTWGCEDSPSYPDTPHIFFHSFSTAPSSEPTAQLIGTLIIGFEDGNADIGFSDTTLTDTSNLFLSTFYRQNGQYLLQYDPVGYRIPEIPKSSYKTHAKGEIELSISFITLPDDSLKFSVYMYDRAGNKSNTLTTRAFHITPSQ